MEYSPKPMLPSKPKVGIISNTGLCTGAACHGTIPTNLARGMKISSGRKSGIRLGTESTEGIRVMPLTVSCRCIGMNLSCAKDIVAVMNINIINMYLIMPMFLAKKGKEYASNDLYLHA